LASLCNSPNSQVAKAYLESFQVPTRETNGRVIIVSLNGIKEDTKGK
jgi:transposase